MDLKTKITQIRDIGFIEGYLLGLEANERVEINNAIWDRFEYLYESIDKEIDEILKK